MNLIVLVNLIVIGFFIVSLKFVEVYVALRNEVSFAYIEVNNDKKYY